MTDKPDLTPEQLDALEYEYGEEDRDDPRVLTLVAMARAKQAAERERDEWKNKFEMVRHSESDALAENDALTFIARTNGFQRDKAERERDALRVAVTAARDFMAANTGAPCADCDDEYCEVQRELDAALAQPTADAGGA